MADKLDWDEFYERSFDWALSTVRTNIYRLEKLSIYNDEYIDFFENFSDDIKICGTFLRKLMKGGVKIPEEDLTNIAYIFGEKDLGEYIKSFDYYFSHEQIDELLFYVDNELLYLKSDGKHEELIYYRPLDEDEEEFEEEISYNKTKKKTSFIDRLLYMLFGGKQNENTGKYKEEKRVKKHKIEYIEEEKLKNGDRVEIVWRGQTGRIISDLGGGYYQVRIMDGKVDTYTEDELKKLSWL